jgi:hypothetical protein
MPQYRCPIHDRVFTSNLSLPAGYMDCPKGTRAQHYAVNPAGKAADLKAAEEVAAAKAKAEVDEKAKGK